MSWPDVSIIMTVVNEERHLADAVEALLQQDYPGSFEIVVAVGPSHDRTREVAEEVAARHLHVHVVDNPSGRTPSGLNAAIARSTGTVVVRIDGHAMVPVDYVRVGVETLRTTGADNVGGIMAAEGTTPFECAVARAMTSPFGVGGASFHIGGSAGPALTVYLGCFQRAALERVGGYDDTMIRAQDWEMNLRIRDTGGVVWFTPEMRAASKCAGTCSAVSRLRPLASRSHASSSGHVVPSLSRSPDHGCRRRLRLRACARWSSDTHPCPCGCGPPGTGGLSRGRRHCEHHGRAT